MPTLTSMVRLSSALILLASLASAQINFPDFSTTTNISLNGSSAQSGTALRVNAAVISDRGSAWFDVPQNVASGFDHVFSFQFTQPNAGGGDGMAYVIHNDPRTLSALGNHAGQMGYGPFAISPPGTAIANSVAIELDTYTNGNLGDPNANHVSIHTNGAGDNLADESVSIGQATAPINMSDGQPHTVRVRYVPGTLEIFMDDLTTPFLSVAYDFNTGGTWLAGGTVGGLNLLSGGAAVVGFTAGNGAAWENHDVLSWIAAPFNYQLNSPASALTLNGLPDAGPFGPIAATVAINTPATLDLATINTGLPYEVAVLLPGSPSVLGLFTANAQVLNIDITAPTLLWLNGGSLPNFAVPFAGTSISLPIASPAPLQAGAQMINISPSHPDGFELSHAVEFTVQ